jgi:ferrochelatase
MAYGSPSTDDDIEAYFTHIRGGRPPSPEALRELTHRYQAIGHSPLTLITAGQAAALSERIGLPTFIGMKHAKPFIAEGAGEAAQEGIERLVGLPLAPHYADMSVGAYERELRRVWTGELIFIRGFHDHPAFIDAVAAALAAQVHRSRPERIFFTAHSLPARIVTEGDGYLDRLLESCRLVAAAIELPEWEFAFQSASSTGEPWLGPDLLTAIRRSGAHDVLVCHIGFVSDHLEVLYDLDVEAQQFARELGVRLRRTESFNESPAFIEALAAIVRDALAGRQAAGPHPQHSQQSP